MHYIVGQEVLGERITYTLNTVRQRSRKVLKFGFNIKMKYFLWKEFNV